MNLSITGHHLEVTPALREYVKSKLDRVIRHFDQVIDVTVLLSVAKLQQKAEVNLHVPGRDMFAESTQADLYAAIDTVVDKLDRQVLKHKTKRLSHPHEALKHQPEA
jgi:putative sigma-54 modulation protein